MLWIAGRKVGYCYMKLLFSGIASDDGRFQKILESTQSASFAQQKLERLMLKGIAQTPNREDTSVLSELPVARYPAYPSGIIHAEDDELDGLPVRYMGFINLPVLKQLTVVWSMCYETIRWSIKNRNEDRVVFLYGTNPLKILPLVVARAFSKFKIISFVSEIDAFRLLDETNMVARMKRKLYVSASNMMCDKMDGYILITEHMLEQINRLKKPYIIVEGMVEKKEMPYLGERKKQVMYAGSLHERYGIGKLVKAFSNIKQNEYELLIYGDGDYVPKLKEIVKESTCVRYCGTAENQVIIKAEEEASLLVNPRPSDELFTRYSFPSKTFEYMLSGTPALITRLDGIPEEYFQYCYSFDDEQIDAMTDMLEYVLSIPEAERMERAKRAFEFVNEKNNIIQMSRIWTFATELFGDTHG